MSASMVPPLLVPSFGIAGPTAAVAPDGAPGGSAPAFGGVLGQASQQVSQLRNDADQKVRGLMMGDGTDIHTALIATQKADLAFDLALAVRNKAVGAYQQLMGIQF